MLFDETLQVKKKVANALCTISDDGVVIQLTRALEHDSVVGVLEVGRKVVDADHEALAATRLRSHASSSLRRL